MSMPSEFEIMKRRYKVKTKLKHRKEYLSELSYMENLYTGRIDKFYFNNFLTESIQLLINAIFLMEDGYFDCAFYSARQSQENLNTMLYLSTDGDLLKTWKNKERFPLNSVVVDKLKKLNADYKEMATLFELFFGEYNDLIKRSHKIIHKQGIDTFYEARARYCSEIKFNKKDELTLFSKIIEFSICHLYLIYILLDPIGLILADEELNRRFHYNVLIEPINFSFLKKHFPTDFISTFKTTDFYKGLKETYGQDEEMNDAMYDLIRESFFDLDRLDMIAQQIDLLDCQGKFVFNILQNGFKISNFYFDNIFVLPDYWTSIRSNFNRTHWSKEESDLYAFKESTYNVPYHNVFLSAVSMYNENILIMEHNDKLNIDETTRLEELVSQQNEEHKRMVDELLETLESELMNKHD